MWTSAFSRPRCAMPITTSCAPAAATSSIVSSSIGTSVSSPSRENCFCPRNERRRYCSNPSTCVRRRSRATRCSGAGGRAEAARLDRLAEPHALRVVGDVLDLVGDRAHVDLAEARQRIEERLAGDGEAEEPRRDPRLELRRQRRMEPRLVERGVAHRLRPERIEPRGQMPVHAVRLDERHRRGDAAEELGVDLGRRGRRRCGRRSLRRRGCDRRGDGRRGLGGVAVSLVAAVPVEDLAPLVRHARGRVEVVREELRHVGGVRSALIGHGHPRRVVAARRKSSRRISPTARGRGSCGPDRGRLQGSAPAEGGGSSGRNPLGGFLLASKARAAAPR